MTIDTPTVEDISVELGSRLRTALHLITSVNEESFCARDVRDFDLLLSAEKLLEEASAILIAADPNYPNDELKPTA